MLESEGLNETLPFYSPPQNNFIRSSSRNKQYNHYSFFFLSFKFIEQILFHDLTLLLQVELSSLYLSLYDYWATTRYIDTMYTHTCVLNLRNCYTSQILSRRTFPGKLKHHFHYSETAVDLSLQICVSPELFTFSKFISSEHTSYILVTELINETILNWTTRWKNFV